MVPANLAKGKSRIRIDYRIIRNNRAIPAPLFFFYIIKRINYAANRILSGSKVGTS